MSSVTLLCESSGGFRWFNTLQAGSLMRVQRPRNKAIAEETKVLLDANWLEPLTTHEVARLQKIPRGRCCDIFVTRYGITLPQYVRFLQRVAVNYILNHTRWQTFEAAERLGICPSYFTRLVRRQSGLTLTEYRKANQGRARGH